MKFNWKEMSAAQKCESIIVFVLGMIGLVFAILEVSGKWPNNLTYLLLAVITLVEGIAGWNRNRKIAIVDLALAVFFAFNFFA